jgi:NADH dehydrogenase FAD-containing subunit
MEAAKSLSRAPVEVTVIDRQNHHCFQPLPLKQAATEATQLMTRSIPNGTLIPEGVVPWGISFCRHE